MQDFHLTPEAASAWAVAQVEQSIAVQQAVQGLASQLAGIGLRMAGVLRAGGCIYLFGNGGSAADAQHWAAELAGRFYQDRPGLPAVALTTNTSQVTAIANDYGYEEIFSRPLAGLARPGDMAVGLSTSGRSANVLRAFDVARERGVLTLGFTGRDGGLMTEVCDDLVRIPSDDVARIQEGHVLCAHVICAVVERALFGEPASP